MKKFFPHVNARNELSLMLLSTMNFHKPMRQIISLFRITPEGIQTRYQ